MIEIDTRLRVARGIAKTETQASTEVFETLKGRGHPEAPPAVVSDGWGGIKQAMIAVYGQVPSYKGRGRRPTKKRPVEGWQYLQVVKQRDTHGRFLGTARRVIFGEEAPVLALLGKSTSYIERTHLTMRHMNGRLVGKGLGFSKRLGLHKAQAAWEDLVYNVVRPLKTLRQEVKEQAACFEQRWCHRSPAMAAGLTRELWTVERVLRTVPVPTPNNT